MFAFDPSACEAAALTDAMPAGELLLHRLWEMGLAPHMLTYEGANLDIWVALSAPVAALIALAVLGGSIPIPWIAVIRANDRPKKRKGEPDRFTRRKLDRLALQGHPITTVSARGD